MATTETKAIKLKRKEKIKKKPSDLQRKIKTNKMLNAQQTAMAPVKLTYSKFS